jgi:spermidine synthase
MLLQIFTAVFAVVTPLLFSAAIPLYRWIYETSGESMAVVKISKAVISFAVLLIPTTLMGGTLPVLVSHLTRKDSGFGKNLSIMYSINTMGAVAGVILSGFFTIGLFGEWATILIGAALNLAAADGAAILGRRTARDEGEKSVDSFREGEQISPYTGGVRYAVLAAVFISGFTALAYEVIWTRQLVLYLFVSVYAFSAMLAVFLAGVAAGSFVMNKIIGRIKNSLYIFGLLEGLIAVFTLAAVFIFPFLDRMFITRMTSPLFVVFPASFIFGMIFPLSASCFAKSTGRAGESIGAVYGFNTAGNVLGALASGFIFITSLGSAKTLIMLAVVNAAVGAALILLEPRKTGEKKAGWILAAVLIMIVAAFMAKTNVFLDVIVNRLRHMGPKVELFLNKECTEGTLTSFKVNGGAGLQVNGNGQTKLCTETKLMAYLPYVLADNPQKMLIICFGMGTILKSAGMFPALAIDTVELVPEIYGCFGFYHKEAPEILKHKNLKMYGGDGRNYLLLTPEKYSIISIDPSPPIYSAGTVNLYTKEFFTMCRDHLLPGGVMCLWVPGDERYECQLIIKTFLTVFPEADVWKGPNDWGFYLTGKNGELKIDPARFEKTLDTPAIKNDLLEYDKSCYTGRQLLGLFLSENKGAAEELKKIPVITDDHPYTEFILWR